MTDESPPAGKFQLKLFVTGICLAVMAVCLCFGGSLLVYQSIMLSTGGVIGQALVKEYLGPVTTRRRAVTFENHLYVLEFDDRTLERQLPDVYQVGDKLEIIYVPGPRIWS
jgi:hypothetical protein